MKYTVDWVPTAERDLATIWVDAPDQQEITDAANAIDQMTTPAMEAGLSDHAWTMAELLTEAAKSTQ